MVWNGTLDGTATALTPPATVTSIVPDGVANAEVLAAREVIANVRAMHRAHGGNSGRPWCDEDGQFWPCPTTRALDAVADCLDQAA